MIIKLFITILLLFILTIYPLSQYKVSDYNLDKLLNVNNFESLEAIDNYHCIVLDQISNRMQSNVKKYYETYILKFRLEQEFYNELEKEINIFFQNLKCKYEKEKVLVKDNIEYKSIKFEIESIMKNIIDKQNKYIMDSYHTY